MDAVTMTIGFFFLAAIAAGVTQTLYFRALAKTSSSVSSDAETLRRFQSDMRNMPRANFDETLRRLRALVSRQTDTALEARRWAALVTLLVAGVAFLRLMMLATFRM